VERRIGTYVKASTETNADVGDRFNDAGELTPLDCAVESSVKGATSASRNEAGWSTRWRAG
jgi:NAD-specific glutamate dehydrogenase